MYIYMSVCVCVCVCVCVFLDDNLRLKLVENREKNVSHKRNIPIYIWSSLYI